MNKNCGLNATKFAVEKIVGWIVVKTARKDTSKYILSSPLIVNFGSATPHGDGLVGTEEVVGLLPAGDCYKVSALDPVNGERKELGYIMGAASQPDWEELRATWLQENREAEKERTKRVMVHKRK